MDTGHRVATPSSTSSRSSSGDCMERWSESKRVLWIQDEMDALIADAPVKVFSATNSPIIPYRLGNAVNYRPNHAYKSREYILDSGVGKDMDNRTLLGAGAKLGESCDWIVPKDYPNDTAMTVKSLRQFAKLYAASPIHAQPLIPLQGSNAAEYIECYLQARGIFPDATYFGIGGIAGAALTTIPELKALRARIELVKAILEEIDEEHTIHLFGCTSTQWLDIYQDPRVVSCDSARFGQAAGHDLPRGKHGGIIGYFAVASAWLQFVMEIASPQASNDQHDFEQFFR